MSNDPAHPPRRVFLDTASGEPLHAAAAAMLERARTHGYADPRRLHTEGRQARMLLDNARAAIAEGFGVRPDEVSFTGSGTEAIRLGLLGLLEYSDGMVASAAAHSAVIQTGQWAQARGKGFATLAVDAAGRTEPPSPAHAGQVLAVHLGNHEVATLEDPGSWAAHEGPVFVNACASGARLPLPDRWDAVALSAHKWGGPAGVGVLLLRKDARWRSPWPADDRADPRASGFENLPGALAAGAALQAALADRDEVNARQFALVARLREAVAALPDVEVVGDPELRLPHLVTFSCLLVNGEALVTELDRAGFAVASGSACTASSLEPSHVLLAMGALSHGNVRVSLSLENTAADIDAFVTALADALARLRADL